MDHAELLKVKAAFWNLLLPLSSDEDDGEEFQNEVGDGDGGCEASGLQVKAMVTGGISAAWKSGGGWRHCGRGPARSSVCSSGPAPITASTSRPFSGRPLLVAAASNSASAAAGLPLLPSSMSAATASSTGGKAEQGGG